jgi:hypothetical protein
MTEPRKKFCYIGAPRVFKLELACQHLTRAWGESCYVVGSVLERSDWRDIDVVMMLDDEHFMSEFPDATMAAYEFDPKWLILTVAISDWLSAQVGATVDFKLQPRTHANERHKGKRNAVGLRFVSRREPD